MHNQVEEEINKILEDLLKHDPDIINNYRKLLMKKMMIITNGHYNPLMMENIINKKFNLE